MGYIHRCHMPVVEEEFQVQQSAAAARVYILHAVLKASISLEVKGIKSQENGLHLTADSKYIYRAVSCGAIREQRPTSGFVFSCQQTNSRPNRAELQRQRPLRWDTVLHHVTRGTQKVVILQCKRTLLQVKVLHQVQIHRYRPNDVLCESVELDFILLDFYHRRINMYSWSW